MRACVTSYRKTKERERGSLSRVVVGRGALPHPRSCAEDGYVAAAPLSKRTGDSGDVSLSLSFPKQQGARPRRPAPPLRRPASQPPLPPALRHAPRLWREPFFFSPSGLPAPFPFSSRSLCPSSTHPAPADGAARRGGEGGGRERVGSFLRRALFERWRAWRGASAASLPTGKRPRLSRPCGRSLSLFLFTHPPPFARCLRRQNKPDAK